MRLQSALRIAALATVGTVAFDAATAASLSRPVPQVGRSEVLMLVAEKRIASLRSLPAGLSGKVRAGLRRAIVSRTIGKTLTGAGPSAAISDQELDHTCGDWFITFDEESDGHPVPGTFNLHCGDSDDTVPIG